MLRRQIDLQYCDAGGPQPALDEALHRVFIRLFGHGKSAIVAASFAEGRIGIAGLNHGKLIADIRLRECSWKAWSISQSGDRLVVAYQYSRGIDVFQLPSGISLSRIGNFNAAHLGLNASGDKAVVWRACRGVVDLNSGAFVKIPQLSGVYGSLLSDDGSAIWVPLEKRAHVGQFDFDRMSLEVLDIGCDDCIWTLRRSPTADRIVMLQCYTLAAKRARGAVVCVPRIGAPPIWTHVLRGNDIASNGSFTGDGRYFLLNANEAKCVIVIDTELGAEVSRLPFVADPAYPLDGSRAMTSSGKIIDVNERILIDYVNKASWWRAAGLGGG